MKRYLGLTELPEDISVKKKILKKYLNHCNSDIIEFLSNQSSIKYLYDNPILTWSDVKISEDGKYYVLQGYSTVQSFKIKINGNYYLNNEFPKVFVLKSVIENEYMVGCYIESDYFLERRDRIISELI